MGSASWLETQSTHAAAIAGRVAAFPEQYESWAGGHIKADQVRPCLGVQDPGAVLLASGQRPCMHALQKGPLRAAEQCSNAW